MTEQGYIRHYRTTFITCPYCGHKDFDSWEVEFDGAEGTIDNFACSNCDREFTVSKHCEITYTTEKEQSDENDGI